MGKKKPTPEEREEILRLLERSRETREQLQEAWDNLREKWRLEDERRARRRALFRRLTFRRVA
jgi:hypothetical protein